MIDTVYQLLQTILNKELRGNLSPAEFNLIARQVQDSIFRGYFDDENRDKVKQGRGRVSKNFANLPLVQRQRIEQFAAFATVGAILPPASTYQEIALPADLYLIKDRGVSYSGNVVDETESSEASFLSASSAASSETFPTYERYSDNIRVYPLTAVPVDIRYLRNPAEPKWTYKIISGTEMFDSSNVDYQDFELHESEFSNIVIQMLSYFGINIRESEIAQYAEAKIQKQDIKEES